MKSDQIVTGDRPLMAIRYNYIYQKLIVFIANEGGGINEPYVTYLSRFSDNFLIFIFTWLFVLALFAGISVHVM